MRKSVSRISNAFATGGGGTNFEHRIQAVFLLSLLIDGFCPALNEPTKCVCFQAKRLGFATDDLAVLTYSDQSEGKLLCQIKHKITISNNDRTFQEVINAAWNDFKKSSFDKKHDRIALSTAQISVKSQQALRFLNAQAGAAVDEADFLNRIEQPYFSNAENRRVLSAIKKCIFFFFFNIEPTDTELWNFCNVFILLLFDLDYTESINRTLTTSLIKANSEVDAYLVWSGLIDYAGECDQNGASVEIDNFDKRLLRYFKKEEPITELLCPIKEADTSFLSLIVLIGEWKEDNKFDRRIIEIITEMSYKEFESKARIMISNNPDYLQLKSGRWRVLHRDDLFKECLNHFFDTTIIQLLKVAKNVFSQKSKFLERRSSYLELTVEEYDNSVELRKSLVSSMCMVKMFISQMPNCDRGKIEKEINLFVSELLHEGKWSTWASLRDCLQGFAELAPSSFLKSLEWNIQNEPKEILALFPKNTSDILGQANYTTALLWALEILAWSPEYLISVVRCLGMLESLPYEKTNWDNKPINSIVSILLPWYPQTTADIKKRRNALTCLSKENPAVFWQVIMKLLPKRVTTTSGNPKPKYLPLSIPDEIQVENAEVYDQFNFNLSIAVEHAKNEIIRLTELVDQIGYMNNETLRNYLDNIDRIRVNADEHNAFVLWSKLCDFSALRDPAEDKGVFLYEERIQHLIDSLEPRDIRLKYQQLYLRQRQLTYEGFTKSWEELEEEKTKAVMEIFTLYGVEAVESFGQAVNNVSDVAHKLGDSITEKNISMIIDSYNAGKLEMDFLSSCISGFFFASGAEKLLATTLRECSTSCIIEILTQIPFSRELLKVVNGVLPNDNRFWQKATFPYVFAEDKKDDLTLAVKKLNGCKRYVTAVNILGRSSFEICITSEELCDLLQRAGTVESIGNEKIDIYAVQKLIKWLQQQEKIDLQVLANLEFIYLPALNSYSDVQPRALKTRLSLEPEYFCEMIRMFYKTESERKTEKHLNKEIGGRLAEILIQYKVVPGVDWNGNFNERKFSEWVTAVKAWSKKNDRYAITMQTVGSGLSYASLDDNGLPSNIVMEELNKPENEEMRRGYYIGIINQRGVHWVDPEGKEELKLAKSYEENSERAECLGFSRYSGLLRDIAEQYRKEAEHNIQEHQDEEDN